MTRLTAFVCLWLAIPLTSVAGSTLDLEIGPAWSPPARPGQQSVGVAYLTLQNTAGSDVVLTQFHSPKAKRVEVHTHTQDAQGVMRMEKLDALTIPANSTVAMKPGGLHVMLFDYKADVKEGASFPLFIGDDLGEKAVEVLVRASAPESAAADDGHTHHH
jgi:copper(I)-binding protein